MRLWILAFAVACAWSQSVPVRVLFIGNSYTYYNHLAGLVEGMAKAAGVPMEAKSVTRGGATLEAMYLNLEAREMLANSRWDFVVLQDQSTLGLNLFNGDWTINTPEGLQRSVNLWHREIKAAGARTVLLNTWARKGRGEMQPLLDWAYSSTAERIGARVIPAGRAFQMSLAGEPALELYADGAHPSAAGSYLAACTAVEVLLGKGCETAPDAITGVPMDNATGRLREGESGTILSLPASDAAALRKFAIAAVQALQADGGYWKLPMPTFLTAPAIDAGGAEPAAGVWRGVTWLYGKKAEVAFALALSDAKCEGTWTVSAAEPPTRTTLPIENCRFDNGIIRFTVTSLFMTTESHEGSLQGETLAGSVTVQSTTPYHRQTGTWELRRDAAR